MSVYSVYAVINARCDYPRCIKHATWTPGLHERNRMLEYLEMLTPDYLMTEAIPGDVSINYPKQAQGWQITEDGQAFCPEHVDI